jgi:hypothetical protein
MGLMAAHIRHNLTLSRSAAWVVAALGLVAARIRHNLALSRSAAWVVAALGLVAAHIRHNPAVDGRAARSNALYATGSPTSRAGSDSGSAAGTSPCAGIDALRSRPAPTAAAANANSAPTTNARW